MAAPPAVEPTSRFALFLSAGALLVLVGLAVIMAADKVQWLASPPADVTDTRPAHHRANGTIQALIGFSVVAAVAGVAFGIAGLRARRDAPSARNGAFAGAAIALGVVDLPLSAVAWVWGQVASTPWSFG